MKGELTIYKQGINSSSSFLLLCISKFIIFLYTYNNKKQKKLEINDGR